MAKLGRNTKLTIDVSKRQPVRALFEGALGSKVLTPSPDFEVYVLDDEARVGVAYVPAADALSSEDQKKGAWLEFVVDDEPKAREELGKLGLSRIDYADKAHAYYQVPGGPVFRLAPR
jgi:hypothetical protein